MWLCFRHNVILCVIFQIKAKPNFQKKMFRSVYMHTPFRAPIKRLLNVKLMLLTHVVINRRMITIEINC